MKLTIKYNGRDWVLEFMTRVPLFDEFGWESPPEGHKRKSRQCFRLHESALDYLHDAMWNKEILFGE